MTNTQILAASRNQQIVWEFIVLGLLEIFISQLRPTNRSCKQAILYKFHKIKDNCFWNTIKFHRNSKSLFKLNLWLKNKAMILSKLAGFVFPNKSSTNNQPQIPLNRSSSHWKPQTSSIPPHINSLDIVSSILANIGKFSIKWSTKTILKWKTRKIARTI